ncbi:uncharacterized protein LOC126889615 [Diabrotica virgifera virgifera]|uniref:Uncharacterized protein n=1 Tax=Diabrotica virgifera virgifera TaxID=50390 RepID=A0ABM5KV29_DIAVI|nr:uncharacterized protein LOC126889615 [Diabrotica virgifera virgifera]
MFKWLVFLTVCSINVIDGTPVSIICEEAENKPEYLCWLDMNQVKLPKRSDEQLFSDILQPSVKRNSELSSALKMLYGQNNKRNPELSNALMSYMRNSNPKN